MDSGIRAVTVGDGTANFSAAAHLWLEPLNASSPPPLRWDRGGAAEGTGQRLLREQAYRDFTTAIQVFILIGSLLGKSLLVLTHILTVQS